MKITGQNVAWPLFGTGRNACCALTSAWVSRLAHRLLLVPTYVPGGGAGLATACDMAIATADAKFSFSEVRLGLIAATISPYVVGAVGPRTARALFATGQVFDAAYADKVGLITEVVADVAALDAARARIGAEMMACAPGAVADSKKLVEDVAYKPIEDVMEETAKRIARTRVSPEGQEGVRAFLDKRKPSWAQ